MSDKEKTLQEFKDILTRVSEDSSVSMAVRKVIKYILLNGITIIPEKLEFESGPPANAYLNTNTKYGEVDDVPFIEITPNTFSFSESFIFLDPRPISEEHNNLLVLVHELAHAAFDMFLSSNTEKILDIFYTHGLVYMNSYPNGCTPNTPFFTTSCPTIFSNSTFSISRPSNFSTPRPAVNFSCRFPSNRFLSLNRQRLRN